MKLCGAPTKPCPQCGGVRDKDTVLCGACFRAQLRSRNKGRICPTCGVQRGSFATKDRCSACYHKLQVSKHTGTCIGCGKTKHLRRVTGLCGYCHSESKRRARPRITCSQCGKTAVPYCGGMCRPCYTNNAKRLMKYGLEAERYLVMLEQQGGHCAICEEPMKKTPHVDHDHATGMVRSLLCDRCNLGLGSFGDNPERLRAAAKYIEAHRARKVA